MLLMVLYYRFGEQYFSGHFTIRTREYRFIFLPKPNTRVPFNRKSAVSDRIVPMNIAKTKYYNFDKKKTRFFVFHSTK